MKPMKQPADPRGMWSNPVSVKTRLLNRCWNTHPSGGSWSVGSPTDYRCRGNPWR